MNSLAKKLILAFLCLGAAWSLSAQTTVKGIVTDESGEPLIGAGVFVEGTTIGTVTGLDGDYELTVPADAVNLVYSFIGLADQTVPINGRTQIDVVLATDTTVLDEVVVVGYQTVKRRDLLGSVSSVNSDKLTEQPVTTVSQALTGKMAGVSVVTTEGDPDADIKIRVRGGSSITQDNSPLYIVDGFPVESINDISSSEIASIDVLKDAFSTAIYGARGANGVVIVTTKGAEKGQKISVKVNAYGGPKWMANRNAVQAMEPYDFVQLVYELAAMSDKVSSRYEPYFGTFSDMDLYRGVAGNNWVDAVFGNTGYSYSADASISGSGEGYNWTASYAHLGDQAIMAGSNYSRDNISMKGNFKTSKTTSVDLSVRYARVKVRGSGANSLNDKSTSSGNGRLKHAVVYSPLPIPGSAANEDEAEYGDYVNPLQSVRDNDSQRLRTTLNLNAAFNWTIVDKLKLKIEGGIEDHRQSDDRFYGISTWYVFDKSGYPNNPANEHKELFRTRYRNTNTLNYDFANVFKNEDHSMTALLGQELTVTKSNTLTDTSVNFPSFFDASMAWNYISSAGLMKEYSNIYSPNDVLLSFFGRVNYDYKHRYSVGATLRADASSKFANPWGFFPSAAASWTISNEPWMDDAHSWLDQLKLRYSFGTAGNNNIPSGQLYKQYKASAGFISQNPTYYSAGDILNNPDLRWETTYTHNIGLDFSFWQSKLNGSIEVYQNSTKDLLINYPISGAGTGYATQYRNIGSTRNRGIELTLNAPVVSKKDFSLNLNGNIAFNKNVVTDLGGLEYLPSTYSKWASSEMTQDYLVTVGQPIGNIYGYRADGRYEVSDFDLVDGKWKLKDGVVDATTVIGTEYMRPGAMKLKDLAGAYDDNGNPIPDGKVDSNDMTVIGNALPDFTGGFGLSGFFKGIDFSANFNFMLGNQVYNANKIDFTSSRNKSTPRNQMKGMEVSKRWTNVDWATGEIITDPEKLAAVNAGTTMWSPASYRAVLTDWAVEDGSFLRLQNVTIGYTFPEKLTEKIHLRKARIYVTGTNLFCLTKYSGFDPEVDTRRETPLTPGVDYSAYPKSIGCVAGINLTF